WGMRARSVRAHQSHWREALSASASLPCGGSPWTPSFRHAQSPLSQGRKKVRTDELTGWVGDSSLAADRRRPSARFVRVSPNGPFTVNRYQYKPMPVQRAERYENGTAWCGGPRLHTP